MIRGILQGVGNQAFKSLGKLFPIPLNIGPIAEGQNFQSDLLWPQRGVGHFLDQGDDQPAHLHGDIFVDLALQLASKWERSSTVSIN